MDDLFNSLADSLGASVDQIKVSVRSQPHKAPLPPSFKVDSDLGTPQLITCLLISYPLGSIFVRVPSVGLKHAFSVSVTLFYLLGVLNMFNAFFQLLLDILVTYYLAKGMTDKRMPWLVFMCVLYLFLKRRNAFIEYRRFTAS